jgi:two-component system response regulator FixJ
MADNPSKDIFLVDDEPDVRLVVSRTLESLGFRVTCFSSGTDCLRQLRSQRCDLLIADVKMSGMDGLELLNKVKRMIPSLPILIVTGYGDIPMVVTALKAGASDFLEKPLDMQSLQSTVASLLAPDSRPHPPANQALTKIEADVLQLILEGKSNSEIAKIMCRSHRTIEDHRANILRKFDVDNLVDLVRQVAVVRMPSTFEKHLR